MALVNPLRVHPVPLYRGRKATISSGFHEPNRPNHSGSDFSFRRLPEDGGPPGKFQAPSWAPHYFNPHGTPIVAAADGQVVWSKQIGTGGTVKINHGGGWETESRHLVERYVKDGERVSAGQPIGGQGFNPLDRPFTHLHFEVRKDGKLIDPAPFVAGLPMIEPPSVSGLGGIAWGPILVAAGSGLLLFWYLRRSARGLTVSI